MTRRLAVLAIVCALGACGPHGEAQHAPGSTLTVLYPGDERILGPYWSMPAQFLMFDPLFAHDERGDLVGRLARAWDHTEDYREWTIHLRADVRWHDGTPLTARDVRFTSDLVQHPAVAGGAAEVDATVVDDTTVLLVDRRGNGIPVLDPYQVIYPEHLLADLAPEELGSWEFWVRPVGTGPFEYVRHSPQTMMEFRANAAYYRGPPEIERLILKFGQAAVPELLSGDVQVAGWATAAEAAELGSREDFVTYWQSGGAARAILWRHDHPLFADARTRRAMTHAIDRRELIRLLHFPDEIPLVDAPFTERQHRRGELPEPLPHDPDLAARLLDSADWRAFGPDGLRRKAGRDARFELLVPDEVAGAGVYIQDQLRRVGVRVDILTLGIEMIRDRWRSADFDGVIAFADGARLERFFGDDNLLGYRNERAAALTRRIRRTPDPGTVDSLYTELASIVRSDQPATFLFPMPSFFVVQERVRGLSSPWYADPLANLNRLRLAEDR